MMNLKNTLIRPWLKLNSIVLVFIFFSLIGFIDAAYLAIKFYTNTIPPCSFLDGCEQVTTSAYAAVGGVSVALIGAIYYLTVLLGSIFYLDTKRSRILVWLSHLTWIGFLASIYFVVIQIFLIKALCIYCLFSAGNSTILFIAGRIYLKSRSIEESR